MSEPTIHAVAGLGPVGRAVVDELVLRGIPVRAISRHRVADLPPGVEVVNADITDPEASRLIDPAAGRRSMVVAIQVGLGVPVGNGVAVGMWTCLVPVTSGHAASNSPRCLR